MYLLYSRTVFPPPQNNFSSYGKFFLLHLLLSPLPFLFFFLSFSLPPPLLLPILFFFLSSPPLPYPSSFLPFSSPPSSSESSPSQLMRFFRLYFCHLPSSSPSLFLILTPFCFSSFILLPPSPPPPQNLLLNTAL
jgi:hypothetical protein